MFYTPENWEDIQKYYNGCYMKVEGRGDSLFYFSTGDPSGLYGVDEFDNPVCIELDGEVTSKRGYDFTFLIPKRTWFQKGSYAYFLTRIPARMWKKGISKENTSIKFLDNEGCLRAANLDFENLKAYTNKPHYLSYKDIGEHGSIALSPRFAMDKTGNVYLDEIIVGKYVESQNLLLVRKLLKENLSPLFPGVKQNLL